MRLLTSPNWLPLRGFLPSSNESVPMIFATVNLVLLLLLLYMSWDQAQRIDEIEDVLEEMLTEEDGVEDED